MSPLRALPLLALTAALVCLLVCLPGCSLVADRVAIAPPPADYAGVEDGFRYTKSCLTPQEQYVYDQLLAGLKEQAEEISGLYPDNDLIGRAIQAVDRDYPELFWFSGEGTIQTTLMGDTPVAASYCPRYVMDEKEREETQAQIDAWAADCFAGLPEGASDYDKAIHVYQYIINHSDYQTVEDNSIVNIMVKGAGLCGCYAKTAQYLLAKLGVDSTYASGIAGGENHAWNLLWLDGNPTWMDPTWGDPVFEGGDPNDGPSYEYFGLTSEELSRTHTLDDTVPMPHCTSGEYNYFRQNGLYFDWYDPRGITAAMEKALTAGWKKVPLQFGQGFDEAASILFGQQQVYSLFRQASQNTGVPLHLDQSLWYTQNETMHTVAITVPY